MSGLLQKADLTMLEEQIQKMQNAYEYAEKPRRSSKRFRKIAGTRMGGARPDQKRAP